MDLSILAQFGQMESEQFVTAGKRSNLLAFAPGLRHIPRAAPDRPVLSKAIRLDQGVLLFR
jgi:hypothetical protein